MTETLTRPPRSDDENKGSYEVTNFEELYGKYFPVLTNIQKRSGARDPEDLAQETLIKAWRQINKPESSGSVNEKWLKVTLGRGAIDDWRKRNRRVDHALTSEMGDYADHPTAVEPDASGGMINDTEYAAVTARINELLKDKSERWHRIYDLHFVQGKNYAEVSEELGIPLGSIRSGISRIRNLLESDEYLRKKYDSKDDEDL